jgi:hypothetical protein
LNIYNKSEDEVLRLLVSKLPSMGRFICQYIKRDGSICGKGCMSELGCARYFNALPRTICLSVRWKPIPRPESVAHMVEFITMPGTKIKKLKQNLI